MVKQRSDTLKLMVSIIILIESNYGEERETYIIVSHIHPFSLLLLVDHHQYKCDIEFQVELSQPKYHWVDSISQLYLDGKIE